MTLFFILILLLLHDERISRFIYCVVCDDRFSLYLLHADPVHSTSVVGYKRCLFDFVYHVIGASPTGGAYRTNT
jgi:hypothetical protein